MLPDLEVLGTSENGIAADLVKELLSGCHKKSNYQNQGKLYDKFTS